MNQRITEKLKSLSEKAPGDKITIINIYEPFQNIYDTVTAGEPYQFTFNGEAKSIDNVTDSVCKIDSAMMCPKTNDNNFLFTDIVHPTGLGQEVAANTIYDTLIQENDISSLSGQLKE